MIENPTDEQRAIIDYVAKGEGHLVVDAKAGTGKTTTLLAALAKIPQRSVLICAFNTRIAEELQSRMPTMPRGYNVMVKTFHALGLKLIRDHYRHLEVSKTATEDVLHAAVGPSADRMSFRVRRAAVQLLRCVKENIATPMPPNEQKMLSLGVEHGIVEKLSQGELKLTFDIVRDGYLLSLDLANRQTIDYPDMVWAPLACRLPPKSRYLAVLVDEFQDISEPQLETVLSLMAPKSRLLAVGDPQQEIYQWRNSMGALAWAHARDKLHARVLPLTITWRCDTAIVDQANQIVPELRARPGAGAGLVSSIAWKSLPDEIKRAPLPNGLLTDADLASTYVLSRNNRWALSAAMFLWKKRVAFELNAGKEMLDPLIRLLDDVLDLRDRERFLVSLQKWHAEAIMIAEKANAPSMADRADEERSMLEDLVDEVEPTRIKRMLYDLITPNASGVLISTVHKVKGLEADRVFLLRGTFERHTESSCKACGGYGDGGGANPDSSRVRNQCWKCGGSGVWDREIPQEELNIEYVAITRCRKHLIWVDLPGSSRAPVKSTSNVHPYDPDESEEAAAGHRADVRRMLGDGPTGFRNNLRPVDPETGMEEEYGGYDDRDPQAIKDEIDLAADIELDKLVRPEAARQRKQLGIKTEAEQLLERSRMFMPGPIDDEI